MLQEQILNAWLLEFPTAIYKLSDCASTQQRVIDEMGKEKTHYATDLRLLHAIIAHQENLADKIQVLNRVRFNFWSIEWLRDGNLAIFDSVNLSLILDLIKVQIDGLLILRNRDLMRGQVLQLMKELFFLTDKPSCSSEVKGKFAECISAMWDDLNEGEIREDLYCEFLCQLPGRSEEFFQFFETVMLRPQPPSHQGMVFRLLKYWESLLELFCERELTKAERNHFCVSYSAFSVALMDWPRSIVTAIFEGHDKLFDYFFRLMAKKIANEWKLSDILNNWSHAILDNSSLSNYRKFPFLLRIYKETILHANETMIFLDTQHIAPNHEFLAWFYETQLKKESSEEIVEIYLATQFGTEFFLVMAFYICHQFPTCIDSMYGLLVHIDLFNEVCSFLDCENVREYLRLLFGLLGQQERIIEYINSIQDQQVLID